MKQQGTTLILASGSPRRLELLRAQGIEPVVIVPALDEEALLAAELATRLDAGLGAGLAAQGAWLDALLDAGLTAALTTAPDAGLADGGTTYKAGPDALEPAELARTLALAKARAVRLQLEAQPLGTHPLVVLAADTLVYKEGMGVLGKPANHQAAVAMLEALRNTWHLVATGVALIWLPKGAETSFVDTATVHFGEYSRADIEHYLTHEPPFDKAGSYGIQDSWGSHVTHVEGSRSTVMGLPIERVTAFLSDCFTSPETTG